MTVDEFVSSIGLLLPKIAIHMPSEVKIYDQIVSLANELIAEMNYVCNPVGAPPLTLGEYVQADFRTDRALVETILHQDTDRLIQINAGLSYLSTQALSGAVPILERRSLIRRYSLLGVGTAILALTRLARCIEKAFSEGALETGLATHAPFASPLPGLDKLPNYDPRGWKDSSVNRWHGTVPAREPYPKLPYFSGTLGFRESEYTISAAIQALAAGGSPEWSLLTLTHEMVHGHVRSLLSIILQGEPDRRPEATWQEFYQRFSDQVEGRPISQHSFLDSLRAVILFYCCMTITHGSLTRPVDNKSTLTDVSVGFYLPNNAESLRLVLETEFRNINEVLVHVLDLHYFYRSSLSAYVPLIWRSWSIMPQVRGDLRQYLLRTLLVAATKISGTPFERFRQSLTRVSELLARIKHAGGSGTSTIDAALEFLSSKEQVDDLFFPFMASLVLVDLTHHVLTSNAIRGSLNGADPHLKIETNHASFEEWFEYAMPDGFVDDEVAAPAAFIADRLSKKLLYGDAGKLEFDTVLMFLACCSQSTG
ncbi:MAG TPA: hypothetical protein VHP37_13720 [Burkholderiales bacterium]|nr:hypothetical protein [Burkholderiales bacterium]